MVNESDTGMVVTLLSLHYAIAFSISILLFVLKINLFKHRKCFAFSAREPNYHGLYCCQKSCFIYFMHLQIHKPL